MKVLYSWLKEYVDIDIQPEILAERLNYAGISVESIEKIVPSFKGVITAKILEVKPHPNAEKLQIALIDSGKGTIEVVCGAKNIAPGQIVPFAPEGSTLKNGEIRLEARKIRGFLSRGMLCSEAELELGDDESGILILSEEISGDIPIGVPLEEALGIKSDYLFEFELPSNRPDAFSVVGIAREVAALFNSKAKFPDFHLTENGPQIGDIVKVEVEDENLCPRYTAKAVLGVINKRSPFWMRWRLLHSGIRPISAIVDVTNYVMLETGQPLHAFDLRFVKDGKIIVRASGKDEKITTLDGVLRTLREGMLLIADSEKPIALAGIMGAENSEVKEDTTDVIIESAHFDSKSIMRTSRILGLNTEASTRFEKKVDPEGTVFAAKRAAYLMRDICGGNVAKGEVDIYKKKAGQVQINVRHNRIEKLVGMEFSKEFVKRTFENLGFKVEEINEGYRLTVPTFRPDIEREIDAIEEIARIYGYDRIESTLPSNNHIGGYEEDLKVLRDIRERALRLGFTEVITNPLLGSKIVEISGFSGREEEKLVKVVNPLSNDLSILSPRLALNLIYVIRNNFTRSVRNVRIFELGRVFKNSDGILPEEKTVFAAAVCGNSLEKQWWGGPLNADLYDLKGLAESVFGAENLEFNPLDSDASFDGINLNFLEGDKSAIITSKGRPVGYLGAVKSEVLRALDIDIQVYVMEIIPEILKSSILESKKYQPVPLYPAIVYDFSFIIPDEILYSDIRDAIISLNLKYLESVEVFDVYKGKGIEKGKKSMAIRLVFRSPDRTLEESEVRDSFEAAMSIVKEKFGADIRRADVS
ncbi:MAG: phenylalanine--tRNA ligase subunit beta [Actinobacteria bacterium]|nr:phenylalanine--tRNA ligase subunit beta [Actinomycetota bacterium]